MYPFSEKCSENEKGYSRNEEVTLFLFLFSNTAMSPLEDHPEIKIIMLLRPHIQTPVFCGIFQLDNETT